MKILIREDSVHIEGYVNAIERLSKPLMSRLGQFLERICKGAFFNALKRNDDVKILLNHDPTRVLGSQKQGNLELEEDSIGLRACADITDPEVIKLARQGDLVGWSFGFYDMPDGVEEGIDEDTQLPVRKVREMYLEEVSILDRTRTPAYDGTLIMARDDKTLFTGESFIDEVEIEEETRAIEEESAEPETANIDYSVYENLIKEMKEDR